MQDYILNGLLEFKDEGYKAFHCKLMPTVNPDTVIGVRVPNIRKLYKEICKNSKTEQFINSLPHRYYEENNMHALIIGGITDFNEAIEKIDEFLPYINNWATCDMLSPKAFKTNKQLLLTYIEKWLQSRETYTVRFGIKMLMDHFLDADFDDKYLKMVASIKSEEYYVNMMCAWYFATALAKQYNTTIPYIEGGNLPKFVHNKTISKAIESYRVSKTAKAYLKTLRK